MMPFLHEQLRNNCVKAREQLNWGSEEKGFAFTRITCSLQILNWISTYI